MILASLFEVCIHISVSLHLNIFFYIHFCSKVTRFDKPPEYKTLALAILVIEEVVGYHYGAFQVFWTITASTPSIIATENK